MQRFVVNIPLIATEFITVVAEDEVEALAIAKEQVDNYEVSFDYDPEPASHWWVDEEE